MVKLNKIYTRTGDDGTTALVTGERRSKADCRVVTYGTVDELNAAVGLARLQSGEGELDQMLARIQNDLFDLGADFATPFSGTGEDTALRIVASQVARLEGEIDRLNADLEPLRSFVLPGGTPLAAHLHYCRTVARRAERYAVELAAQEEINVSAVAYLNRLSDFFFVASRAANDGGASDVLWVPGQTR
ncbi:cob(I)yrinic acid a,c-diamide adenosyltransferase [Amorphus sp. 3PC139-8]|uniref:cob(I)yrinic acid a,c-diamide adenosyltransferase n=1 Tax=Amorphus sp. 3PC139-8 TaxID=2735676 RepID=UPI00345DCCCE